MILVVMGVCVCGKTTLAAMMAARTGAVCLEGDDFHPAANRDKMAAGIPLSDEDRWPWLDAIGRELARCRQARQDVVASCSALRRVYRDRLRRHCAQIVFIHLTGSRDLIGQRIKARRDHFMPPALLDSQLGVLEPPGDDEVSVSLDVVLAPEALLKAALERVSI